MLGERQGFYQPTPATIQENWQPSSGRTVLGSYSSGREYKQWRAGVPIRSSRYHARVRRAEAVLWRIVGVLLILLGLMLVASPQITYTSRKTIKLAPSTEVATKEPRTIVIPRPIAVLVVGAGVAALIFARSSAMKSVH